MKIWNYYIKLEPEENGTVHYNDKIKINAGIFTGIVAFLSRIFYKHEQKRWMKILEGKTKIGMILNELVYI